LPYLRGDTAGAVGGRGTPRVVGGSIRKKIEIKKFIFIGYFKKNVLELKNFY
jgi:hypothetical protein